MHLEACPDCQAERTMIQDSRAAFKCGAIYQGEAKQTGCRPVEPVGPKLTVAAIPLSEPEAYTLEVLQKIRTDAERRIEQLHQRVCSCHGHEGDDGITECVTLVNRRTIERATAAIEWVRGQIRA